MTNNSDFLKPVWIKITVLVSVILIPLSFMLVNREWLLPAPISGDSYANLGAAIYYDLPAYLRDNYKSGRVSWLIPLHLGIKIVGFQNIIQTVTVLGWISIGWLYWVLFSSLFTRRQAFMFFPWMMYFPFLIGNGIGGGVYQNYGAICYFIASLITWIWGIKNNSILWKLASGALLASCLSCSLLYLNLVLMFPVLQFSVEEHISWRDYLYIFAGILLGIMFWGSINTFFGRPFFYFANEFSFFSKRFVDSDLQKQWFVPYSSMLLQYTRSYIWFYVACYLAGLIELFLYLKKDNLREFIFTLNFIFLFTLWLAWHAIGHPSLFPVDFTYPLQLPAFLMLCNWVRVSFISRRDFLVFCLAQLVLWIALFESYNLPPMDVSYFVGFFLILSVIFIRFSRHQGYSHIPYFLFIAMSFLFTSQEPRSLGNDCRVRGEAFRFYENVITLVQKNESNPEKIWFYSENDLRNIRLPSCRFGHLSYKMVFDNLAYIYGQPLHAFPIYRNPEGIEFGDFRPDSLLVISRVFSKDFSGRVLKRGEELGYYFVPVDSGKSQFSNFEFHYELFRVRLNRKLSIYPQSRGPFAEEKIKSMLKLVTEGHY